MTTSTPDSSDHAPVPHRIAVVSASVRDGRMSQAIAEWAIAALYRDENVEVDLIDLAEVRLPDDNRLTPGGGPSSEVAGRIGAAQGFVFVTPEYNHSYPASLKRLIDWHYREWMLKPALIVGYGVQGGHAAIEHLRGVLAELNMVTIRRCLGLRAPWESIDARDHGRYAPDARVTKGFSSALAELGWWTDVLTDARVNRPFPA